MALTTSLISYYKCDETSGSWLDSAGTSPLTDNNGSGTAAGKIGTARSLASASTQYASHLDNADLSVGDIDFSFSGWFKLQSKTLAMALISKCENPGSDVTIAYLLSYSVVSDTFRFTVGNSSISAAVLSSNFGSPSTGVWYFICAWHDAVANTVNISVNNGTPNSQSYSGGSYDDTGLFALGLLAIVGLYYDGLIDEVGFWKRVLTAQERTDLYNNGNGFAYPFTVTSTTTGVGRVPRNMFSPVGRAQRRMGTPIGRAR